MAVEDIKLNVGILNQRTTSDKLRQGIEKVRQGFQDLTDSIASLEKKLLDMYAAYPDNYARLVQLLSLDSLPLGLASSTGIRSVVLFDKQDIGRKEHG